MQRPDRQKMQRLLPLNFTCPTLHPFSRHPAHLRLSVTDNFWQLLPHWLNDSVLNISFFPFSSVHFIYSSRSSLIKVEQTFSCCFSALFSSNIANFGKLCLFLVLGLQNKLLDTTFVYVFISSFQSTNLCCLRCVLISSTRSISEQTKFIVSSSTRERNKQLSELHAWDEAGSSWVL